MAQAIQLGELDNPDAPCLHGGVFAPEIRQFIGEELAGECSEGGGFSDSLPPFQNETTIRLRPRTKDPCHGRD